jgi:hypothetical protein
MPQVRRGVTPRSGIGRYQVLGLAATVAAVALVGVALAIGGSRPTEREPSPVPSTPIAPTTARFESVAYGYSIAIPDGWDVEPASDRWVAGGWLGGGAFDRFDDRDATGGRPRFIVAATDVPKGTDPEDWLRVALPSRYGGVGGVGLRRCDAIGVGTVAGVANDPWQAGVLAGRAGWVRDGCGFVEGVVIVDRRAFIFSAQGAHVFDGATPETHATFDQFVATFEPQSGPPAQAFATFTSTMYGYSISYPADCAVVAATEPWVPGDKLWAGPQAWDRSPHVDRFCGESETFTVASTSVPDGVAPSAWVAGLRPHGGT